MACSHRKQSFGVSTSPHNFVGNIHIANILTIYWKYPHCKYSYHISSFHKSLHKQDFKSHKSPFNSQYVNTFI